MNFMDQRDCFEEVYDNLQTEVYEGDDRKITVMVNLKCWRSKPSKKEFAGMVPFFKTMTITFGKLEKYLIYGCTMRPAILQEGKTTSEYFEGQQCFFVDIDGTHTVQKSIDICREQGIQPNIIYPTFRYKPSDPHHRIVFIAPAIIGDPVMRDRIQNKLIEIFHSDPNSRDRVRQFAGGMTLFWADERPRLDVSQLLGTDFEEGGEKLVA